MATADHWWSGEDRPLFDEADVPAAGGASVGQLLADVDASARQLLWDAEGEQAAALLRGWPGLVASADRVWQALPDPSPGASSAAQEALHGPFNRLYARSQDVAEGVQAGAWPEDGDPDARLVQMAYNLDRAGRLVQRYGAEADLANPAVRDDVEAARMRVMHSLYATAHATTLALHERGRDLAARSPQRPSGLATWVARMEACESAAAGYVHTRGVATLDGQAQGEPESGDRLREVLAGWERQAHQTLARREVTPQDVTQVATIQQQLAEVGQLVAAEAGQPGLVEALEPARQAWEDIRSRWHELSFASKAVGPSRVRQGDPALASAAAEVRMAFRDVANSPADYAGRLDAIREATRAGAELAPVVTGTPRRKKHQLYGPARALSARAETDAEAQTLAGKRPESEAVWVDPRQVATNQRIPMPAPARQGLGQAGTRLRHTTAAAAAAVPSEAGGALAQARAAQARPAAQATRTGGTHTPTNGRPSQGREQDRGLDR